MEDKFGRIVVACPHCGQKLRCEPGAIGTCPKCQTKLEFPMSVTYGEQAEQKPMQAEELPAPKKKKSKLPIILVVLVLVLALGGAAFWYFVLRDKGEDNKPAADAAAAMLYQDFGIGE